MIWVHVNNTGLDAEKSQLSKNLVILIRQWGSFHERYSLCGDLAFESFAFGERSQVALLSAAVWQGGGVSLCDYSEEKHKRYPSFKTKASFVGACDIYAFLDHEINGYEFYGEAKYERMSISPNRQWNDVFDNLNSKVDKSSNELIAEDSLGERNILDVPIVSISFRMLSVATSKIGQLKKLKTKYLKAIEEFEDYHLSGVFFLDNAHIPRNDYKSTVPLGVSIHMKIYAGASEILNPNRPKR